MLQWVKFWVGPALPASVTEAKVPALFAQLGALNTYLDEPLDQSCVMGDGVGLLRQQKDPTVRHMDGTVLLCWFRVLEALLDHKPDESSARPEAFLRLWCQVLAQGGALCCNGFRAGTAVWQAFQGLLGLQIVEMRCRNSNEFWRRVELPPQVDRECVFQIIHLMEMLWDNDSIIPAGWALTVQGRAVAHEIPSFAVMGQQGDTPPYLVCGICADRVLVPPGLVSGISQAPSANILSSAWPLWYTQSTAAGAFRL